MTVHLMIGLAAEGGACAGARVGVDGEKSRLAPLGKAAMVSRLAATPAVALIHAGTITYCHGTCLQAFLPFTRHASARHG